MIWTDPDIIRARHHPEHPRRPPHPAAGMHCQLCGTTDLPRNIYWTKPTKIRVGFGQTIDSHHTVIDPVCSDCHTDMHLMFRGMCRHEAVTIASAT